MVLVILTVDEGEIDDDGATETVALGCTTIEVGCTTVAVGWIGTDDERVGCIEAVDISVTLVGTGADIVTVAVTARFLRGFCWNLLLVTCQPTIPYPRALPISPFAADVSRSCKIGKWSDSTFPQPTSHEIKAPGNLGNLVSPGPATRAVVSNMGLSPTGINFSISGARLRWLAKLLKITICSDGLNRLRLVSKITVEIVCGSSLRHLTSFGVFSPDNLETPTDIELSSITSIENTSSACELSSPMALTSKYTWPLCFGPGTPLSSALRELKINHDGRLSFPASVTWN